jgi:hypothetical protein
MQSAANRMRMRLALYYKELDILILFYHSMILNYMEKHDVKSSAITIIVPPPQICFPDRKSFPDSPYLMSRVANMLSTVDKFDVTWIPSHPFTFKCEWPLINPVIGTVVHSDGNPAIDTPPAKIAPPPSPLRRSTTPIKSFGRESSSSKGDLLDIPESDLNAMLNEIL